MGSMADQLSLIDAYDGFCRAERLASGLRVMPAYDAADRRFLVLTHYAVLCGWDTRGKLTDWAAKRVELIRRTFPNHVKEAR